MRQDRERSGQQCSWPGPRKDLKFLTAGEMARRSTAMEAEAAEETRPDHDTSASLFQSSHFILRVHCTVFSKGGTRSDLHSPVITLWRIGLERKQT